MPLGATDGWIDGQTGQNRAGPEKGREKEKRRNSARNQLTIPTILPIITTITIRIIRRIGIIMGMSRIELLLLLLRLYCCAFANVYIRKIYINIKSKIKQFHYSSPSLNREE